MGRVPTPKVSHQSIIFAKFFPKIMFSKIEITIDFNDPKGQTLSLKYSKTEWLIFFSKFIELFLL